MSQWQNFSYQPQMNNPYQNNYGQPMQMQNPYLDRMNQLQSFQQNLQQPQIPQNQPQGIIGRVVNDFSEITANDVPMNGNAAFFPKADGSELQVRSWSANGTIQTVVYRPIQPENKDHDANIPQNDFVALNEDVRALREEISERFDRLEKSMGNTSVKTVSSKTKKVDSENE